jgi:lipopolysaccharide export system permease protein
MARPRVSKISGYLISTFMRNFLFALTTLCMLFLIFDLFERIDEFLEWKATFATMLSYFFFRIPFVLGLMLPVAALIGTLLSLSLLSKSGELTAIRAAGLSAGKIARPILGCALITTFVAIAFQELVVPYSTRRANEIFLIDVKQRDRRGELSQNDIWWRSNDGFYSVRAFDSRTNTIYGLSKFVLNPSFEVVRRTDAAEVSWINETLGWSQKNVTDRTFSDSNQSNQKHYARLPLPIGENPSDLYDTKTDPNSMNFRALRRFIREQARNGISAREHLPDLYSKLSFPFVIVISVLVSLPFGIRQSRGTNAAKSFAAGLCMGFSYFAIHSLSVAMGRAELLPPLLSAWVTNLLLTGIGAILLAGADSPQ